MMMMMTTRIDIAELVEDFRLLMFLGGRIMTGAVGMVFVFFVHALPTERGSRHGRFFLLFVVQIVLVHGRRFDNETPGRISIDVCRLDAT